jgi:hypothetical protein
MIRNKQWDIPKLHGINGKPTSKKNSLPPLEIKIYFPLIGEKQWLKRRINVQRH